MSTLKRVVLTLTAPLLFTACGDDTAGGTDPTDETCEVTEPTRLIAAPDGWQPADHEVNFWNTGVGDRVLYSFQNNSPDGLIGDVYLRDLCGGEPEQVLAGDGGLRPGVIVDFAGVGPVLYGWYDQTMYVVDRLDEPGADTPAPVDGLDLDASGGLWAMEFWERGPLFIGHVAGEVGLYDAAGIGGPAREVLALGPTPDAPAVLLADDVVHKFNFGEQIAVHTDDGALFLYDQVTGERTPVAEDVRWASPTKLGDRTLFLIQDMVDDVAEPVRLLDLETGESREVTVNDFVQSSFGRDPEHGSAGSWTGLSDEDSGFIALHGPDGGLLEGYDVATLEPIEIPDNVGRLKIANAPWLPLILPDPNDTVYAAWSPHTGELREWYRGPKPEFDPSQMLWKDGELEYTTEIGEVSRYDQLTGETTVVLPRVGGTRTDLEDGRIVTAFPVADGDYEVVVIDPETGTEQTLVAATHSWRWDEEHALVVYTDFGDPEPGLWATPIPPR